MDVDDAHDPELQYDEADDDDDDWVLEAVLKRKGDKPTRHRYLCSWRGYEERTWETRERLIGLGCLQQLSLFDREMVRKTIAEKERHVAAAEAKAAARAPPAVPRPPVAPTAVHKMPAAVASQYNDFILRYSGSGADTVRQVLPQFAALQHMWRYDACTSYGVPSLNDILSGRWPKATINDATGEYTGQCRKGTYHGHGKRTWSQDRLRDTYTGMFSRGEPHGQGLLHYRSGAVFRGELKKGVLWGEGTLTLPSGLAVTTMWERDAAVGDCFVRNDHGGHARVVLDVTVAEILGVRQAALDPFVEQLRALTMREREVAFSNGHYVGSTLRGQRHGRGRYEWSNRHRYEGEWCENQMHGQGVYTWPDGRVYTGPFRRDEMHGQGRYDFGDGAVFEGEFKCDLIDGKGTFRSDAGVTSEVEWHGIQPTDAVFLAIPAFASPVTPPPDPVAVRRAQPPTHHADPRTAAMAIPSDLPPASLLSDPGVDRACVICQDERKTRAVVPCGHMCVCDGCALTGKVTMCPLCRVPAQQLLKLYL